MNEFECAGACDLSTDNARRKKDVLGWAVVGGVVDGERMNVLICVVLLDFLRDDDDEGLRGKVTEGVGGYEWMLAVLSSSWCVNSGRSMGREVHDLKDRDASTW